MLESSPLTKYDVIVIVLYFILILGIGFLSFFKGNRSTVSGYFLAGRYMIWLTVGGSLFASNIGSEHFVGLAGSGASSGIGVAAFEFNAAIVLQLLGCLFLPVYIASGANTLPEYMKKRFGGTRIRTYLSCLYIILYVFAKISVDLYSGALFVERGLNWNMYASISFILFMTVICTVTGGLTAVMYTDTVQTFLILIGAAITAIISIKKVGGLQALKYKYMNAIPTNLQRTAVASYNSLVHSNAASHFTSGPNINTNNPVVSLNFTNFTLTNSSSLNLREFEAGCGLPRLDSWVILRNAFNSDVPWLGIFLGQTTVSLWYWCTDQMMVQRALAAKSLSHAQGGTIFVGYLKLLPLFLLILPGMASRVLYTDLVACSDPDKCFKICGNRVSCANIAYPLMAFDILPAGLKGVMFSVMLAALMSDLGSVFNSASTLFTIDIWQKVRRKASVKELMIVGRCFVLVMVAASVAWIPIIQSFQGGQLYIYIQSIGSYLAPPIACVFLLAVLWPRCNEQGAFWSLMCGLCIGLLRMFLDLVYKAPACGQIDLRPPVIGRVHFLYFAAILFWITGILCVTISYLTAPLPNKYLVRTTYWTRFAPSPDQNALDEKSKLNGTAINIASSSADIKDLDGSVSQYKKVIQNCDSVDTDNNIKNIEGSFEAPINEYELLHKRHTNTTNNNNNISENLAFQADLENSDKLDKTPSTTIPEGLYSAHASFASSTAPILTTTTTSTRPSPEHNINSDKSISNQYTTTPLTLSNFHTHTANNSNNINIHKNSSKLSKENIWLGLKWVWNWFLGFENEEFTWAATNSHEEIIDRETLKRDLAARRTELAAVKSQLQAQRLEKIQSLKQAPLAAFLIKLNVVIIISLALFIMLYYSF